METDPIKLKFKFVSLQYGDDYPHIQRFCESSGLTFIMIMMLIHPRIWIAGYPKSTLWIVLSASLIRRFMVRVT